MPDCQEGDGLPAVFVGTMLQTGDGFCLCDQHLAEWAIGLVSIMTGVDPAPFIQAISEPEDGAGGQGEGEQPAGEGDGQEQPPPPRVSRERGRGLRESLEAGTESDPGESAGSNGNDAATPENA